jgi:Skp family chaperone for outer membrane proteins
MNLRMTAWVGLIAGVVAVAGFAHRALADDTIPPSAKLATCDPIKVLNQIQEGKDAMAKWKQDGESLQNQANVKKGQLQTEQDEIKLLLPTSDEFEKKVEKFTQDQADTQAWFQSAQVNMARKQRLEEKALFDKILKTVADLAQAQNILIVVNSAHAEFPDLEHMDANAFVNTILLHTSLFTDAKLDITQQVIIAMDKAYSTSH